MSITNYPYLLDTLQTPVRIRSIVDKNTEFFNKTLDSTFDKSP